MTRLIEWLLDLENIRLGRDAPLLLKWESEFAGWMLLGFALAALAWVTLNYRRERTSPGRRLVLAVVRCSAIAFVVAMLCRPTLVLQRNRVETSHVAVVLDTSLSMATRDRYSDETLAATIARGAGLDAPAAVHDYTRLELLQGAFTRDGNAPLARLLEHNAIQLYTFSGAVEPQSYADSAATLPPLVEAVRSIQAEGMSTDLAQAIRQVIDKAQGRRLAAVVLASDGRSTQPTSLKDALDLATGRQIPIFPLRIGSPDPVRDVEVGSVRAQDGVFVNDILAVEAQLSARGLTESTPVRVALVDERNGATVATQTVSLDPTVGATSVELRTKPTRGGAARYRVEAAISPNALERWGEGSAITAGETNTQNNTERVDVAILEGGLRLLYVEGYPRYEYRYLKNALVREQTMQISGLLIEADEQFIQEGTDPIRRFPDTPEELNRYDVVLFGDVDPRGGCLTAAQMNMLLDFVGNEGGGFGLIAGERAAPHRYLGTPLEKLIPVSIDSGFLGRYDAPLVAGYRPQLTAEGQRSRVFRFAADRATNATLFESLPELYWVARTLGPRPGASVLAEHPTLRTATGAMPIVVTGRYGAGKLFFQATDDTWRWRRHNGEFLHDSYWVQVARELMRDARTSQDRRYVLRTDRRTYAYGEPVRVQVEFFDAQLLSEQHDTLPIALTESGTTDAHKGMPSSTGVPPVATRFDVHRTSPQSSIFEGAYVPPKPGGFALESADIAPRPGDHSASVLVRVERPDLEARRPEADHEVLERIAAITGGRVLDLDQLEGDFAGIRDRSVQIPDDVIETLWDSKLILMLFVLMISTEWGLRKAFGLL